MDALTPTLSEIRGTTSEPSTLQVTLGSLDRSTDQSIGIFSGLAGLLALLLVIAVVCVLRKWNKRKKRQGPYLRVTVMPLPTLPRLRQQAKNIYDSLPQRQEEQGRRQSRSVRIFSTESLFSRNSDSPPSAHMPSQADNALQVHRAHSHAVSCARGIYDNATEAQMYGNPIPSAHYINVRAAGDSLSISSEDSRDYVNVPIAEEVTETLASTNTLPRNLLVFPSAQELESTEEKNEGCGDAHNSTSFWSPATESNDSLSDEEGSSQTSNDYVNMAGLDLRAIQGEHPWMSCQCCRDYADVPPADLNRSQQQAEEVTSSNTDHVERRADGLGTHVQLAMQSGKFLDLGDYVTYQPPAQNENSQMTNEDSNDYENMLAVKLESRDCEQGPDTQLLPDELRSSHPAGKLHGVVCPARSKATTGLLTKTFDHPSISVDSFS
ncbi:lymphocyte transmembrane adapter 1 [Pteropus medius]|uniref:lymphocyte transmembrane adapter 1 n=1 Tax=Pteropus vampyrus TaxID=132908 RepID=UPI00196A4A09|nr:lymphocyte transmembrane adapter 1 [Pteropus giganteus]XP_039737796.1 lymphocyte transmembrane adapter 1 [Pteropus giganteus]XP_039737797.1 lymphocyte transmembrane adapter 1 [Pteropus giganteus]